eukprot:gnl/TRDRNA2_/TRDRNA2_169809_c1_seq4.p1 gnl/TRDRNA2_/TRDRNA2_169809_c1~~gnl/TRDRNA2_/TRDRNA2_169809_c1_seq4.p1  ORF type:complete len:273 (-),score=55.71 gnl/TRDRNA2_/TRDRNA2_169809_c1_seq4:13-831(-)
MQPFFPEYSPRKSIQEMERRRSELTGIVHKATTPQTVSRQDGRIRFLGTDIAAAALAASTAEKERSSKKSEQSKPTAGAHEAAATAATIAAAEMHGEKNTSDAREDVVKGKESATESTNSKAENSLCFIADALLCSVCMDIAIKPVSLGCGHTFCFKCMLVSAEKSKEAKAKLRCPMCREIIYSPPTSVNLMLDNVVKVLIDSLDDPRRVELQEKLREIELEVEKCNKRRSCGGPWLCAAQKKLLCDQEDGVLRCPSCNHEIDEDVMECSTT